MTDDEKGILVVIIMISLMFLVGFFIAWIERYKTIQPW